MVHRDPETGQFVSGPASHSQIERFSDYEFVHVHNEYNIDASDLPGSLPVLEENAAVIDLDSVLDRDELADLIMLDVHGIQASIPGTSSAESSLRASLEIGVGTGSRMLSSQDRDDAENDSGSSGVLDFAKWSSDSPDVLWFADWNAEASFADSSSGLGGASDAPVLDGRMHFPREFGACPAFDERDEISESFKFSSVGSADISDSLIRLTTAYSLVFAVEEREHR